MNFFTSDLHLGHVNIMKFCPDTRPFADVDTMDAFIVQRWNSVVRKNDDIWHLGDFTLSYGIDKVCDILNALQGHKHFIYGNHDQVLRKHVYEIGVRTGIVTANYEEISLGSRKVCLFHYPIAEWNNKGHGSLNLHGHCHGTHTAQHNQLDVGWDSHDFDKIKSPHPGIWSADDIFDALRSTTSGRLIKGN